MACVDLMNNLAWPTEKSTRSYIASVQWFPCHKPFQCFQISFRRSYSIILQRVKGCRKGFKIKSCSPFFIALMSYGKGLSLYNELKTLYHLKQFIIATPNFNGSAWLCAWQCNSWLAVWNGNKHITPCGACTCWMWKGQRSIEISNHAIAATDLDT